MKLSRALLRNDVNNHKLSTLSNHFKTSNKNEHNAKADVLTTYEVFKHLSRNGKIKDKKNINELNSYLNGLDDDLKERFPNAESAPKSEGIYYFLKDNSIQYVGKSNNLKNRIKLHNTGKGAKFTRGRKWKLIYKEKFISKNKAILREYYIKKNRTLRNKIKNENFNTTAL